MRTQIFQTNLAQINNLNALYISNTITYTAAVNIYSDLTFQEFASNFTGLGSFSRSSAGVAPETMSRGNLPVNPQPQTSLDFSESSCNSSVRNQVCNSCSAHSAVAGVEYCVCMAGERDLSPRSVQQVSECTDGRTLDQGSQIERSNSFCESGYPDVHLDYIIREQAGQLEAESLRPESRDNGGCESRVRDQTRARVTDFLSDFFTTEDYLIDSLSQFGPTSTNIAVTPMFQFYGGGIYYNPDECSNYIEEEVPVECQVTRAGRDTYTCLENNGVDCAQLMPDHCDIFFNPSDSTGYHHSVTVLGYGQDQDGTQFWKIKNSHGDTWGEGGYMKLAMGFGHCFFGTFFALPQCS